MKGYGDEFTAQCFLHSFEEIRKLLRLKGGSRLLNRRRIPSKQDDLVKLVA
jgi:hypothetical protein